MEEIKKLLDSEESGGYRSVVLRNKLIVALDALKAKLEGEVDIWAGRGQVVEYLLRYYISTSAKKS